MRQILLVVITVAVAGPLGDGEPRFLSVFYRQAGRQKDQVPIMIVKARHLHTGRVINRLGADDGLVRVTPNLNTESFVHNSPISLLSDPWYSSRASYAALIWIGHPSWPERAFRAGMDSTKHQANLQP